jgi:HEAT repeats
MAMVASRSAPAGVWRSRRRWFAGAVVVLAIGLVCVVIWHLPSEPSYHGKALSQWLQVYSSPLQPSSHEWKEADEAVSALGTNCLPTLLRMLRARDSRIKVQIVALLNKQKLIKTHPLAAAERIKEAAMAFVPLGELGKGAVPDLVNLLYQPLSADSRAAIEDALARIGPAARPAIPVLLRNTGDPDPRIRANALWALGQIHAQPELCVPQLVRGLSDNDDWARVSACHALGMFGAEAQAAVPRLKGLACLPNGPIVHMQTSPGTASASPPLPTYSWLGVPVALEARKALEKIDPRALPAAGGSNEITPDFGFPDAQ